MQNVQYEYLDGRYRKLTSLGSEEKKSTYLARDEVSGQIVVKKYIQLESASVYEQISALNSDYLVKIFHVARGENNALVIMEYVSGRTIEEWQKENIVFSENETITYIEQLLKGLNEIHKLGIIHRDMNPKNVLISADGVVKLLDFDIGRQYKQSQGSDTTILGTVGFAAPEQFGFTQSDKRTDIYAVGALMNVMLTGKLPGEQAYTRGKMGDIIRKCTQIDPENRYQDVEEIRRELETIKKPEAINEIETDLPLEIETPKIVKKNEKKRNSIIPGFRTGKLWKKILALIYYIWMGFYSLCAVLGCSATVSGAVLEFLAIVIYIWLAILLPLNFLDWMSKVPKIRSLKKTGRILLGVGLWILLYCAGVMLEDYVYMHIVTGSIK